MRAKNTASVLCLTIASLFANAAHAQLVRGARPDAIESMPTLDSKPDGKGRGIKDSNAPKRQNVKNARQTNGISYHGGPVILGTTNVYYIWYGNWSGNAAMSILPDFASNIGGSPYYNINTTYYNGSGTRVKNSVAYNGSTSDNYSQGSSLTDAAVQNVVSSAIAGGRLPKDSNAVYFVLTSKDVKETSGFCTQYCGWHTHATISGTDIKYAFVGDPSQQCPSACEEQTTASPNGSPGADAMVSIVAHELEEAVTDPDLNAWYDVRGQENADKCAWTFGSTSTASNGSLYNVTLGPRQYLIQQNWVNASGGRCSLSY